MKELASQMSVLTWNLQNMAMQFKDVRGARTSPTYNKGHRKKLAFTNRFYLTFFLNSIGLLAKKEKNHNNVT
jgi:hypothetical protein